VNEIERKYLLDATPGDLPPGAPIRQGYLAVDGPTEVRIRSIGDRRVLTVKGGHGLERAEVELDLDQDRFDALWPLTQGRQLDKTRHEVPLGSSTAEVDVYHGSLDGLLVAEVEFDSVADAAAFEAPDWFGRDVTGESGWSNASLAASGRPDQPPG
jgi:CYTH domain-containing protein